ncbi:hypothetical protein H6G89_27805 [Oscillatoria sp. FACHB-1407]|uniref:hypothetical protein n=1 Tax=Oscillatoria sp. FACHB-1407 TaxID=2692847 RepID=UPI001688B176|nr:hypothetical protein [Oscillatoria sp. FACHB-1407]MBD2464812.1 hypothetical protein [Oscillatoria sp. FACHB-1407]
MVSGQWSMVSGQWLVARWTEQYSSPVSHGHPQRGLVDNTETGDLEKSPNTTP